MPLDPHELNEIEAEAATIIGKHHDVLQREPDILDNLRKVRDRAKERYENLREKETP